jgi:putative RecB family exonuclease
MGTSAHEACEKWELSFRSASLDQVKAWYREAYVRECNEYLEETPDPALFESSGPYKGAEDAERRFHVGQEHVQRYVEYYQANPDQAVWITPEGEAAIELEFEEELGGVTIRGKIDAVIAHPKFGPVIRDTKTGADAGTGEQLAVYRAAVLVKTGVDVKWGDYLMTKAGKPKPFYRPHDLTVVSLDEVTARFKKMDEGVKAEVFTPNPGPKCGRCSVRDSCEFRVDKGPWAK